MAEAGPGSHSSPSSSVPEVGGEDAAHQVSGGGSPEALKLLEQFNEVAAALEGSNRRLKEHVALLQDELARKNEEIQRKRRLAALGEMAAGVAHEIRNPLGAIRLYAGALERQLTAEAQPVELVDKIVGGVRLIDTIVEDMLAFTRAQTPELVELPLAGVVAAAVDQVTPRLERQQCRLASEALPEGCAPRVEADHNLLMRAFVNVMLNAAEAMEPSGGGTVSVSIYEDAEAGEVRLAFRDEGPGVSEDSLPRLFDPFYTTRDRGIGLGLSIVHRIVEDHHGKVEVSNPEGGGALFVMTLPLVGSEAATSAGADLEKGR